MDLFPLPLKYLEKQIDPDIIAKLQTKTIHLSLHKFLSSVNYENYDSVLFYMGLMLIRLVIFPFEDRSVFFFGSVSFGHYILLYVPK